MLLRNPLLDVVSRSFYRFFPAPVSVSLAHRCTKCTPGAVQALFLRGRSPRVRPPGLIVSRFLSVRGALTSQILRKCLKAYAHSKRAFRSPRSGTLRLKTRYHPFRSARSRLFKDLFLASSDNAPPLNGGYMWGRIPPGASLARRHPYNCKRRAINGTICQK